jgi:ankyrin repeat protein
VLNDNADPNICYEGVSPLYTASRHGHTEIVELLLNNKADPNTCYEGVSPLYTAIRISFIIQQQFDNLCMTVVRSGV